MAMPDVDLRKNRTLLLYRNCEGKHRQNRTGSPAVPMPGRNLQLLRLNLRLGQSHLKTVRLGSGACRQSWLSAAISSQLRNKRCCSKNYHN
jgi:hypothetical protein